MRTTTTTNTGGMVQTMHGGTQRTETGEPPAMVERDGQRPPASSTRGRRILGLTTFQLVALIALCAAAALAFEGIEGVLLVWAVMLFVWAESARLEERTRQAEREQIAINRAMYDHAVSLTEQVNVLGELVKRHNAAQGELIAALNEHTEGVAHRSAPILNEQSQALVNVIQRDQEAGK